MEEQNKRIIPGAQTGSGKQELLCFLFTNLGTVLEGSRDLSLAGDTGLFFIDAVELYLLQEGLQ